MQTGGSNSQSARYLQQAAWPGRLNFAIRSLFTALGVAREAQIRNPLAMYSTLRGPGGSNSQSARYLQQLAWPGRLTFAIRSLFTALGVAREAQIRNPLAIYSTWRGLQQLTNANHDVWRGPGRAEARGRGGGVSGEGAWSGGRGFVSGNPRQIKQSHTPSYTSEQCAADCQRFASTAAHFTFSI